LTVGEIKKWDKAKLESQVKEPRVPLLKTPWMQLEKDEQENYVFRFKSNENDITVTRQGFWVLVHDLGHLFLALTNEDHHSERGC